MKIMLRIFVLSLFCAMLSACTTVAPRYNTNFDNVQKLRNAKLEPVRLGEFDKDPSSKNDVNGLKIRGGNFESPYGSYVAYLLEAVKQELDDARLLDPKSSVEISSLLIKNEIDVGMSVGFTEIEARFIVKRDGQVRYDKIKSARHEWESSFPASIAVPRAQNNYPVVFQKVLGALWDDKEFLAAMNKN
jgi:hypothetical protein